MRVGVVGRLAGQWAPLRSDDNAGAAAASNGISDGGSFARGAVVLPAPPPRCCCCCCCRLQSHRRSLHLRPTSDGLPVRGCLPRGLELGSLRHVQRLVHRCVHAAPFPRRAPGVPQACPWRAPGVPSACSYWLLIGRPHWHLLVLGWAQLGPAARCHAFTHSSDCVRPAPPPPALPCMHACTPAASTHNVVVVTINYR